VDGEAEAAKVEALAALLTSDENAVLARDTSLLAAGRPQLLRRYLAAAGWDTAAALQARAPLRARARSAAFLTCFRARTQLLRATIAWRTKGKVSACLDTNLSGAGLAGRSSGKRALTQATRSQRRRSPRW
jgi:hypothetical protein